MVFSTIGKMGKCPKCESEDIVMVDFEIISYDKENFYVKETCYCEKCEEPLLRNISAKMVNLSCEIEVDLSGGH